MCCELRIMFTLTYFSKDNTINNEKAIFVKTLRNDNLSIKYR